MRQGFGTHFSIASKEGKHNLVTEYDHKAEKQIISFITEKAPRSRFLAEESGGSGPKEGLLWIVDPLDGTVNFAHTIPMFSVMALSIHFQGRDEKWTPARGFIFSPRVPCGPLRGLSGNEAQLHFLGPATIGSQKIGARLLVRFLG